VRGERVIVKLVGGSDFRSNVCGSIVTSAFKNLEPSLSLFSQVYECIPANSNRNAVGNPRCYTLTARANKGKSDTPSYFMLRQTGS